jgi:hypothetical protein
MNIRRTLILLLAALLLVPLHSARCEPPTRNESLAIAKAFAEHAWTPKPSSTFHGRDADGVDVRTPDAGSPGVAYKWGGFDTLESFDRGIAAGKAAGDVYTAEKRRLGGDAVSGSAVGVDCSGFISRCWGLASKRSTGTLVSICSPLDSADALLPADILNQSGGHVLLFVRWLDEDRIRALFYEADPFTKVRASERTLADLTGAGFKPMRYRKIRED